MMKHAGLAFAALTAARPPMVVDGDCSARHFSGAPAIFSPGDALAYVSFAQCKLFQSLLVTIEPAHAPQRLFFLIGVNYALQS